MTNTCRSLECSICCDKTENTLNMTIRCTHKPSICQDCINKYVNIQLNQRNTLIKCLIDECDSVMEYQDVQRVVSQENFQKFDDVCLKLALQSDPDFRWCQSGSECGSGQIHVEGNKSPKMICEKCGKATCYTHNASWHEGITCNEYDIKNGKTDIESQAYLEKNTKPCPKCGIHIQKIDGCDHIKCKIESCLMEFCWLCLMDWEKGEHLRTCPLYEGVEVVVSDTSEDEDESYEENISTSEEEEEENTESSEESSQDYLDRFEEENVIISDEIDSSSDDLVSDSSDEEQTSSDENDFPEESTLSEESISSEKSTLSEESSSSEKSTSSKESTSSEDDISSDTPEDSYDPYDLSD